MEIIILKNDAFIMLQDITRGYITNLESTIISRLKNENFISGDPEDCGKSLDEIREFNGAKLDEFVSLLFRSIQRDQEIPELIKHIFIYANGSDDPCPNCGCELESETDGFGKIEWTEKHCSNTECDFFTTNEPDWDLKRKP